MQVIVFDIRPLPSGEAFLEWHEQLPSIKTVGFVFDAGHLVQALHHKTVELIGNGRLELPIDLNDVVCDDCFEIGCLVDVCTDVVFIYDDGCGSQ